MSNPAKPVPEPLVSLITNQVACHKGHLMDLAQLAYNAGLGVNEAALVCSEQKLKLARDRLLALEMELRSSSPNSRNIQLHRDIKFTLSGIAALDTGADSPVILSSSDIDVREVELCCSHCGAELPRLTAGERLCPTGYLCRKHAGLDLRRVAHQVYCFVYSDFTGLRHRHLKLLAKSSTEAWERVNTVMRPDSINNPQLVWSVPVETVYPVETLEESEWACPHCQSKEGTWFDRSFTLAADGDYTMPTRCCNCGKDVDEKPEKTEDGLKPSGKHYESVEALVANKPICVENWEIMPYSSEHLWPQDRKGLPTGNCLKCGKAHAVWTTQLQIKLVSQGTVVDTKSPSVPKPTFHCNALDPDFLQQLERFNTELMSLPEWNWELQTPCVMAGCNSTGYCVVWVEFCRLGKGLALMRGTQSNNLHALYNTKPTVAMVKDWLKLLPVV